jgi:RNA binding exosome subunit
MSTDNIEARINAQERLIVVLQQRIEELSRDMQASFKQLVAYHVEEEGRLHARFNVIHAAIANTATKQDIANMATQQDVATIKQGIADMPTRADMVAMETRILDAFKQMIAVMGTQSKDK